MKCRRPIFFARVVSLVAFYSAYAVFGILGVATSLLTIPLALVFKSPNAKTLGQYLIHYLFRFFVSYLEFLGLVKLHADELEPLRGKKSIIIVANHPSLLDVVFLAARLPNVFCLMKSDLASNWALCGQARLAGYVNNKPGPGLIKACTIRIAEGSNLLVFPEGTRSSGEVGPFKMGFALLSRATGATVQTVLVNYNNGYLGKGWPFLRPPSFPICCTMRLGKTFYPAESRDTRTFGCRIERYLRGMLTNRHAVNPVLIR